MTHVNGRSGGELLRGSIGLVCRQCGSEASVEGEAVVNSPFQLVEHLLNIAEAEGWVIQVLVSVEDIEQGRGALCPRCAGA